MLAPKAKKFPLIRGTAIAESLAAYYKDGTEPSEIFSSLKPPDLNGEDLDEWKRWKFMLQLFPNWEKGTYPGRETVEVETTRTRKLGPSTVIDVRPDAMAKFNNLLWCVEHKSVTRVKPQRWAFDPQSQTYCWVTGAEGTLYNLLTTSAPYFHPMAVARSVPELASVEKAMRTEIREIRRALKHPSLFYPSPAWDCTSCFYRELCLADLEGNDRQSIVQELFEKREEKHVDLEEERPD